MKKILKKSLACMLAAILCLTACVGAMASVGAAGAITYSISDVELAQGESGKIDIAISNFSDVAGLIATFTAPEAVASIDGVTLNDTVVLSNFAHYVINGTTVKFVGLFNSLNEFGADFAKVDEITLNIAVTVKEDAEQTTYDYAAPVFDAADVNEIEITANAGTIGKFTVKYVCPHAETTTVVENEKAADCVNAGSYDNVVKCVACGEEISRETVTVDAKGHAYDEGVETTAPDCENAGVMTFTCANCGDTYTQAIDALGHKAGEAVEENRVEAKPGVAGSYDLVVYCTVCKAEISRTTEEIEALPEEVVAEEDASIVVRDAVVSVTATLDMRIRVRKSVIPAGCVRAEIVATPTIYDGSYNPTTGVPTVASFEIATASANLTMYPKNFGLFALDLPLNVQINCYDANDNLFKYSPAYTYYPAEALKDAYKADAAASEVSQLKLNTAITDLLNMSAASQKFFASQASATSALKATVDAGNLVNKDWPQDFASKTEPEYNTINNPVYGEGFNATDNELRIAADLSGAPILSYTLRKAKTAYPDRSKLKMVISYTSYYGKAAGGELVFDEIEGDEWDKYVSGNHLVYKFRDCAMYDGNKTVTVVVTYDGKQVIHSEYSLETYIAANSTNGSLMAEALKAVGIFGAATRAYFSTMGTVDAK